MKAFDHACTMRTLASLFHRLSESVNWDLILELLSHRSLQHAHTTIMQRRDSQDHHSTPCCLSRYQGLRLWLQLKHTREIWITRTHKIIHIKGSVLCCITWTYASHELPLKPQLVYIQVYIYVHRLVYIYTYMSHFAIRNRHPRPYSASVLLRYEHMNRSLPQKLSHDGYPNAQKSSL